MSAVLKNLGNSYPIDIANANFTIPLQPFTESKPGAHAITGYILGDSGKVEAVHNDTQWQAITRLAPLARVGHYEEPGCGKTLMSTYSALFKQVINPGTKVIVTMPPILLNSWNRWLTSIGGIGKVVVYRGTPPERARLEIEDASWILMSIQIFKRDIHYLERKLAGASLVGIADEGSFLKNTDSDNFKLTRDFFAGHDLMILTGTPLSQPGDVYAYTKFTNPGAYRSYQRFRNTHIKKEDFFGKPVAWQNLDLLQENLLLHSCRMLKENVLHGLKEPIYRVMNYPMDKPHRALYDKLVEEQLLELEDGGKIDATSQTRLYNAAQQIIANLDHFSGNPNARATVFDLVDQTLEELGIQKLATSKGGTPRKLLIFALYKMTNRALLKYLQPYGAVACYSEISRSRQDAGIDSFMNDPDCRILIAQPLSAGYGLNLQDACSDVLFVETPVIPAHFHQGLSRVYRQGQKNTPLVRIAQAEDTIQVRLYADLLGKDKLVNAVQIGYKDLADAINGN